VLTLLKNLAHRIVARPVVYDLVQKLVGSGRIRRHLQEFVKPLGSGGEVLDLGCGTGLYRGVWSTGWNYICLDNDPEKLRGFLRRNPQDSTLLGDVAAVPMGDASLDAIISTLVSHHLSDDELNAFVRESARLLRPGGNLIFLDVVWQPRRVIPRLLWKFDRGVYPRTRERLLGAINGQFELERVEKLVIPLLNEYVLCSGTPRPSITAGVTAAENSTPNR
jgi:SAM-dependent methyltransferase